MNGDYLRLAQRSGAVRTDIGAQTSTIHPPMEVTLQVKGNEKVPGSDEDPRDFTW